MNASHGTPPFEPAAHPPAQQGAAYPSTPSGPGRGGPPPVGVPAPVYRADQAFAPGDDLPWSPLSKRHSLHRLLSAALWAVPVGGVGGFLVWTNGTPVATVLWGVAVVLTVVLMGAVAELDRRSFGYAERANDLIVTHGVFVKRLIVVPYGRMQFVDVTAGLLERWMGIATVRMHTAAAATDATIPGLPSAEAASLRDRLAQKGDERSMGL
ncbi:PH domain-containing protein [Spirillospora albida]|uniref:PH domain-containing protein n=1 Tax=Spirillospora albida TaxID=58123 RepID=UPI000A026593|nr:PH domain-containing protein [Spirillospora albida]